MNTKIQPNADKSNEEKESDPTFASGEPAKNVSQPHRKNQVSPPVTILLGGGIDSTALIAHYRARGMKVNGLHVNYGQPPGASEWSAVQAVGKFYKIKVERVKTNVELKLVKSEYISRNAFFTLIAAGRLGQKAHIIALGIHKGSTYYDCSPAFVSDMQRILDGYFAGLVQLDAPFLSEAKNEIIAWSHRHKVPLERTYSCERQSRKHCGKCLSCRDRRALGLL